MENFQDFEVVEEDVIITVVADVSVVPTTEEEAMVDTAMPTGAVAEVIHIQIRIKIRIRFRIRTVLPRAHSVTKVKVNGDLVHRDKGSIHYLFVISVLRFTLVV